MNRRSDPFRPEDLLAHSEWARALARRLVADDATADDLVQETFVAALRTPPSEAGPLRPWLGRVLGNVARQRARGEGRRAHRERRAARDEALPSVVELTERTEAQRLLMEALLELDEAKREVVLLRYFEGLSSAEIARRQSVPAGTVRWRLKQGLDELRERLDARFGGDRERWHGMLAPLVVERAIATGQIGLAATLAGAFWMKAVLFTLGAAVLALAVGLTLVATGAIDAPFAEPPLEPVVFEPLESVDSSTSVEPTASAQRTPVAAPATTTPAAERATVRMRFLDPSLQPVAGVVVNVQEWHASTTSDPDGIVELDLTPHGPRDAVRIAYGRAGFANDVLDVHAERGKRVDVGDIVLSPGGALAGRVVDEDGEPLAGAEVLVRGREISAPASGGMRMTTASDLGAVQTETDEDGGFQLDGLLAGEVRVEVESEDGLNRGTSGRVEVRAGQRSTGLVVVAERVADERRVEGVVLDPAGEPVAWTPVKARFRSLWYSGSMSVVTNAEGRFRFVLDKPVELDVEVRDHEARWNSVVEKDVRPGTLDLVLRFEESRTFALRLVDAKGEPVERASVHVRTADDERHLETRDDGPTDDGVVRLRIPDGPFRLEVLAPGFDLAEVGPLLPHALADEPLRVELVRLPGIKGRVLVGGAPVAGVDVSVHRMASQRTFCDGVPVWAEPDERARGTTDEDGAFVLTLRERGRHVLRAEAQGHAPAEHGPFQYEPSEGLSNVVLELGPGGAIEGRVVRADGLQTSAIVLVSRGDAHARTQRTDPDGHYRFEHLMPGPWQVLEVDEELSAGSGSWSTEMGAPFRGVDADCTVVAGETTLYDLGGVPSRPVTVRGRLQVAQTSTEGWTAELLSLGGDRRAVAREEATLDAHGRFEVSAPRPGRYRLIIAEGGDAGLRFLQELDLTEDEVAWEATASLGSVELTGLATNALPTTLVWERDDGLWALAFAHPDPEGRAVVRVPAGRVTVVQPVLAGSDDPREWPALAELRVVAGGTVEYGAR